jgi:Rieske Fe-S protein
MSSTRREFIRRVVASSLLLAVGAVAIWDLFDPGQGSQQPPVISLLQTSSQQTSPEQSATSQQSASSQQSTQQTSQTTTQSSTSQQPPSGYVLVAPLSALNGKTSAYFNHPTHGLSLLVNVGGQWKAFSATCTHQPCTVQYAGSQIQCPCHGGAFDPNNGAVLGGPPPTPLPELGVVIQNGNLYVSDNYV